MSSMYDRGKVFVGNLPPSVTDDDLLDIFDPFGPIEKTVIKFGYGFVVFVDVDDARAACLEYDGTWHLNRRLNVRMAIKKGGNRTDHRESRPPTGSKPNQLWRPVYGPVAAHSQPPPDRRRPSAMSPGIDGYLKRPRPTATIKNPETRKTKDYRLIVNNLSSTVKWRDIGEFMRREGNLVLADHGRRQDCDKSCFVDFATRRGMEEALKNFDGLTIAGKTVRVYIDDRVGKPEVAAETKDGQRRQQRERKRCDSGPASAGGSGRGGSPGECGADRGRD